VTKHRKTRYNYKFKGACCSRLRGGYCSLDLT